MDYKEKKNLYKCRETVLEMLEDRGYLVPENFKLSFENFLLIFEENNLDIHLIKNEKDSIIVRFMHDYNKNLTKKDLDNIVQTIIETTENENINIVLIMKNRTTTSNKDLVDRTKNVEIFCQDYLVLNPTKHFLVPKHSILSKEEETQVLKKYGCTKAQLPKLPHTDPIAKYYGMKPGDICKIVRNNASSGQHIYYRHIR